MYNVRCNCVCKRTNSLTTAFVVSDMNPWIANFWTTGKWITLSGPRKHARLIQYDEGWRMYYNPEIPNTHSDDIPSPLASAIQSKIWMTILDPQLRGLFSNIAWRQSRWNIFFKNPGARGVNWPKQHMVLFRLHSKSTMPLATQIEKCVEKYAALGIGEMAREKP